MPSNLITASRAAQLQTLAALQTSSPAYLASLISAASQAIQKECSRDFSQTSYSDYYTIGVMQKHQPILLRQFPIIEVTRVATANRALLVVNSDTTNNQRATVETTATAVVLNRMASAVAGTDTLLYATYPTLNTMANAIAATGHGWGATVQTGSNGSYGLWPSSDLKPLQGAVSAFGGGAYLELFEDAQPGLFYGWEDDGWCGMNGPGWRLDGETGEMYIRVRRGPLVLRIDYTAGFATVPAPVQEATAQLVQWMYTESAVNQSLKSEKIGEYSYDLAKSTKWPTSVLLLLSPFKDHSRTIYR